jgi:type VI secretion system secreted protein VgrG
VITARQKVTIVGAGSYTHWTAEGIRSGTSGAWVAHAASHSLIGPDTQPASFPAPPAPGNGTLELFNKYVATQRGVKGGDYEVVDALGTVKTGKLDANGFASVAGLFPGPASVTFGNDPSQTWEEGSFFGKPRSDAAGGAGEGAGGLAGTAQVAGVLGKSGIAADAGGLASLAQTVQSGLQAARTLQAVGKSDVTGMVGIAGGAASLLGNPVSSLTGAATQAAASLLPPKLADAAANLLPRATTTTASTATALPRIAGLKIPGFVG